MIKQPKYILLFVFSCLWGNLFSQELKSEIFSLLNLDYPGLENVKTLHTQGKDAQAAQALLDYYRNRTSIHHPEVDLNNIEISKTEQQWADDALEHTFFVHKGYQPSYNYGQDIDWEFWPVKDNELRWQLHRHKWFTPLGKAFRISKDEKYAAAWTDQYMDWIKKNPLNKDAYTSRKTVSSGEIDGARHNVFFAWRPLEVSNRLQDQIQQFLLFQSSKNFTPEFLTEFMVNYHTHAEHIDQNWSKEGNHLLFEAQRMFYAGTFFPEFKLASKWRQKGINILNHEIEKQVYADGGHFELDPGYHLAAINIFCKALYMAQANGLRNEFPASYLDLIEKMIVFHFNITYPDYSSTCFSDAKLRDKRSEIRNYTSWSEIFPDNEQIKYFASEGKAGKAPQYNSNAHTTSGFFTFRTGWEQQDQVMVVKAGPLGYWHCQPDNGTFELWYKGKNLFPDSGPFVYAGDAEVMKLRNWFRQSRVHNTLTLNGRTFDTAISETRLWNTKGNVETLVTENPSYEGLKHRRSVFFVDQTYYVIVDEAIGDAVGEINLNYQLCEGDVAIDAKRHKLSSDFEGESNVVLQCFGPKRTSLREEEGWRSTAYRKRVKRTAVSFNAIKKANETTRFITIIYPAAKASDVPELSAKFVNKRFDTNALEVEVKVDGQKQRLSYEL